MIDWQFIWASFCTQSLIVATPELEFMLQSCFPRSQDKEDREALFRFCSPAELLFLSRFRGNSPFPGSSWNSSPEDCTLLGRLLSCQGLLRVTLKRQFSGGACPEFCYFNQTCTGVQGFPINLSGCFLRSCWPCRSGCWIDTWIRIWENLELQKAFRFVFRSKY